MASNGFMFTVELVEEQKNQVMHETLAKVAEELKLVSAKKSDLKAWVKEMIQTYGD